MLIPEDFERHVRGEIRRQRYLVGPFPGVRRLPALAERTRRAVPRSGTPVAEAIIPEPQVSAFRRDLPVVLASFHDVCYHIRGF